MATITIVRSDIIGTMIEITGKSRWIDVGDKYVCSASYSDLTC